MLTTEGEPIDSAEFERRLGLLNELHALAALPAESLAPLVHGLREERYAAGSVMTAAPLASRSGAGAFHFRVIMSSDGSWFGLSV